MTAAYIGKIEGMRRGRRRRNRLSNDLKERRRYRKLKKHTGYVTRCGGIAL